MISPPAPARQQMPAAIVVVAVLGAALIVVPLVALWGRVDLARVPALLREPDSAQLLWVSLSSALWSTALCLVLGVPLALWLGSLRRGATLARLLVLFPLALPPVVAGLALTAAIGRRGFLAPLLDAFGWQFAFAFPGVVASHVFIALPFVVITVEAALRQMDGEVWHSSIGIGMSPSAVVAKVLLPALAPAIATGAGLAFARSLGEFGTTITFAGSMPGVTRTMPIGIYLARETDPADAYALAAILMVLALIVLGLSSWAGFLLNAPSRRGRPVATGPLDIARLRELSAPATPVDSPLAVRTDRGEAVFSPRATTAVVGPNGAGKTTLLGLISGRLRGCEARLGGRDLHRTPAHRRGLVVLTQRPGLPARASVLRAITMATRDAERSRALLRAAGLEALSGVSCSALSGGQAAQVALVRAFAARPAIVLLDEPLAAVDVQAAHAWRSFLTAAAGDRTTIMVSHDPFDVSAIAAEVVVMEEGAPVAHGLTQEVLSSPPTQFMAEFTGLNRLGGRVLDVDRGLVTMTVGKQTLLGTLRDGARRAPGEEATAVFAPNAVTLAAAPQEGSARNAWHGTIEALDVHGASTTVRIALDESNGTITVPITTRSALALGLEAGGGVWAQAKAMSIEVI